MRSYSSCLFIAALFPLVMNTPVRPGDNDQRTSAVRSEAPSTRFCILEVLDVSGDVVLSPGESTQLELVATLTVASAEAAERPQVARDLLEIDWAAGPAELGDVEPGAGKVTLAADGAGPRPRDDGTVYHTWSTRIKLEYRAGARSGTENLPVRLTNIAHGPWGEGSDYSPGCLAWEGRVPIAIVAGERSSEYQLHIWGTYQGEGSSGAASWIGDFSVRGSDLHGAGTRVQVDRGSCFYASVTESFDIGGFIEEGRFHFRLLNYRQIDDQMELPERLDCLVNALKEAGSLLLDVAKRLDFKEVTVPVPAAGSETVEHQGFKFRVRKLGT